MNYSQILNKFIKNKFCINKSNQDNINKNDILKAWLQYIKIEELEHVKIDIGKKEKYREIYYDDVEYIVDEKDFFLKVHLNESVRKFIGSVKKQINITDKNDSDKEINLFFLFPPITISDTSKKPYKEYSNFIFAINISALFSDGQKEFINIPLNDPNTFIPLLAPISEYLEIDQSEIDNYFPINITPIDAVKKITGSKSEDFKELIKQLTTKINEIISKQLIIDAFESKKIKVTIAENHLNTIGFIADIQAQSFNFNLKKDLKSLLELNINKNSIAYDYLFKTHNYDENYAHKLTSDYWIGFSNKSDSDDKIFPLAKGQAIVMQYLQKGKDIIAVQGPPGTGKTTLFLSVIANAIVNRVLSIINGHDFNNWMVIISTSNKAVDNVTERFQKDFKGENWFYFIAGKKERIEKNINRIDEFIKELNDSNFNSNIEKYYNDLSEDIRKISYNFSVEYKNYSDKNAFGEYFRNNDDFLKDNQELYEKSLEFLCYHILKNKDNIVKTLELWRKLLSGTSEENNFKEIENSGFSINELIKWISLAYPVVTSTLSSVNNIFKVPIEQLEDNKLFYLMLSDESGMAPLHTIFPLLYKSKKAIIVGDPKQLEPIVPISENQKEYYKKNYFDNCGIPFNRYSPTEVSAYHRAAFCKTGNFDDIGNGIILDEHRRCSKDIADLFSKIADYKNILIKTGELKEGDEFYDIFYKLGAKHLMFYDAGKGEYHNNQRNTNDNEIEIIGKLLDKIEKYGVKLDKFGNIGIITPYANQEKILISKFGKRLKHNPNNACIGTVHKFQGTEFNIIIFSSVISGDQNSDFINKKPNLLNVAVSRAKKIFITVGDYNKLISAGGYLAIVAKKSEKCRFFKKTTIYAKENEKYKPYDIKESLKALQFKWDNNIKKWVFEAKSEKEFTDIIRLMNKNGYGYELQNPPLNDICPLQLS